ncbi:MAG: cell division protein FtsQ/DivIB [Bacillota bacterium]
MTYKAKGFWKMVAVLCIVVLTGLMSFELLCVNNLKVEGNKKISAEAIKALSGITHGMNMLKINAKDVAKALSRNPYIKLEDIERQFPDTVILHVYEREQRAVVDYLGAYICIDENGTILKTDPSPDLKTYPKVTGLEISGVRAGEALECKDNTQTTALTTLLQFFVRSKRLSSIASIDLGDPYNIVLGLRSGFSVRLGKAKELDTKFLWVDTMLPVLTQKGKKSGTLDVTGTKSATYSP